MKPFEKIQKYCEDVCEQIRWKKARPQITTEVKNHIFDQRDAYLLDGNQEEEATEKALVQMGDAVLVGQEFDRIHKPKPQLFMIGLTGILMLIGLLLSCSIDTSINSLNSFNVLHYVIAFGVFMCCYFLDFTILGKHAKKIYFMVLIISIIGVMLATEVYGRLVLHIGSYSVSLSYLVLIFPIAFTLFVYSMRNKGFGGIFMSGVAYLPPAVILIMVPTLSSLILYTIVALIILCIAINRGWFGVNKKHGLMLVLIPTAIVTIGLIIVGIRTMSYIFYRLSLALNPSQDALGGGYLNNMIRQLLSESVFLGKGALPQNLDNIALLPYISTDYTLVYLTHKFGLIALISIILVIIVFAIIGINKAIKEKSVLGSIISLSVILTFTLQSAIYLLSNLGFGLITSPALPFISYGKTALFINAALIGFMLSVFRTGEIIDETVIINDQKNQSRISYESGKLTINFNSKL